MFYEMQGKTPAVGWAITARNVNHVLPLAVQLFTDEGAPHRCISIMPRGSETIELRGPLVTTYYYPCERVLFSPARDANPFFHLFEALWILAGREDVAWLAWFLPRIAGYSDNGLRFNAPYGYRLRHHFGSDQLNRVVELFEDDPSTRRATAVIFDPRQDHNASKDIPCNTTLAFLLRDDGLSLTVFCRSNDLIWGAYGANVVQFSMILEYIAARLRVPVGHYTQISNSAHIYPDNEAWQRCVGMDAVPHDPYELGQVTARTLIDFPEDFDSELLNFVADVRAAQRHGVLLNRGVYHNTFFNAVAMPLFNAYTVRKVDRSMAVQYAKQCLASDWSRAAVEWLERRAT